MKFNRKIEGKTGYFLPRAQPRQIQLAVLETRESPSIKVLGAVRSAAVMDLTKYPTTDDGFINDVRVYCGAPEGSQILPTHGSDNGLKLICDTFIDHDSRVLIPTPTYPHFQHFVGCSKTAIPASECVITMNNAPSAFEIIQTALRTATYDMCYLVNPSMPLGYKLNPLQVQTLVTDYPECLFVIDECYHEMGGVPLDERMGSADSAVQLCTRENVIVLRTFSKAFGLAALRIGYVVCNQSNYEKLRVLYNQKDVTQLAMAAARAALKDLRYYTGQIAWTLTVKKDFMRIVKARCTPQTPVYDVYAGYGNFLFLLCRDPTGFAQYMLANDVLVRNKHPEIENGVRIAVGSKDQMDLVAALISRLNGVVDREPRSYVFDLDGVLRTGSHPWDPLDQTVVSAAKALASKRLYRTHMYLVTNNCAQSAEELAEVFRVEGLVFDRIVTPVDVFISLHGPCSVYVIGNESCKKALEKAGYVVLEPKSFKDADTLLVLNDFYGMSADEWTRVVYLAKRVPWYVSEASRSTTPRYCAETTADASDVEIPDIGVFSSVIGHVAESHPTILGKPFIPDALLTDLERPLHFIGDSDSDALQAEAWCASYSDVGSYRC